MARSGIGCSGDTFTFGQSSNMGLSTHVIHHETQDSCRIAQAVLSREDPQEAFLKAVPPSVSDVEIIYPVSTGCEKEPRVPRIAELERENKPLISRTCHRGAHYEGSQSA